MQKKFNKSKSKSNFTVKRMLQLHIYLEKLWEIYLLDSICLTSYQKKTLNLFVTDGAMSRVLCKTKNVYLCVIKFVKFDAKCP